MKCQEPGCEHGGFPVLLVGGRCPSCNLYTDKGSLLWIAGTPYSFPQEIASDCSRVSPWTCTECGSPVLLELEPVTR